MLHLYFVIKCNDFLLFLISIVGYIIFQFCFDFRFVNYKPHTGFCQQTYYVLELTVA